MKKKGTIFFFLCVLCYVAYQWTYPKLSFDKSEHLGNRITIQLPSGAVMTTYESYIVEKEGKLHYKSRLHEMDITGAILIKE